MTGVVKRGLSKAKLTPKQEEEMTIARLGLMSSAPFFAYYFYAEMVEHPTKDIPTAATDGRRIYYNPDYLSTLTSRERVFALAHEVYHTIYRHPSRMKTYDLAGTLRDLPFDRSVFNECADYVINADLINNDIGSCNPAWLYDPNVKGTELPEDIYKLHGGKSKNGSNDGKGAPRYGDQRGKGSGKRDAQAENNGGRFDDVLDPQVDDATGREDTPSEAEFKEAIAKASAAAKAMGKLPGSLERVINDILEPQVSWREHVRMLITGKLGSRGETWDRPNRRRLVLNPVIFLPGRAGFGAGTVACAIDTSGSIGEKELSAFFAEIGGIVADVKPKRVVLIWCDARVQRTDEARSLDELAAIRVQPVPGGGGTDFRPVFDWLEDEHIKPDTLIYLTDMYGRFPNDKPSYPTIWCATTDEQAPFGDVVRITV